MINKIESQLLDHIDMTKVNIKIENDTMILEDDNKPLTKISINQDNTTSNEPNQWIVCFSLDKHGLDELIKTLVLFRDSK